MQATGSLELKDAVRSDADRVRSIELSDMELISVSLFREVTAFIPEL